MQRLASGLLLMALAITPAVAQPRADSILKQQKQGKNKQGKQGKQGAADPLERFLDMTPQQRQQALAGVAPERRDRILRALREFDSLPPMERRVLRRRFRDFVALAPARRALLRQELQLMRRLNRAQRRRRLNSPAVLDNFTAQEIDLLNEVADLPDGQDQ